MTRSDLTPSSGALIRALAAALAVAVAVIVALIAGILTVLAGASWPAAVLAGGAAAGGASTLVLAFASFIRGT